MAFDLPTNFTVGVNQTGGIDGLGSLFQYASYVTEGWFGFGIIAIIFVMMFGLSVMMNVGRAFASASFVALIFSVYFARIGAVSTSVPLILLTFVIAGFFWAKNSGGSTY